MTDDRPPVSGEPSTERPHDGSVYLGDHEPLPHGWCRHRWRNRQTRDVICPYSEGYARGLAAARVTPPSLDPLLIEYANDFRWSDEWLGARFRTWVARLTSKEERP